MTRYLLIIIASLLAGQVGATTYYVADSTNASAVTNWGAVPADAHAGTSWATAWASIGKANTSHVAGDTILFSTGVWRDSFFEPKTGTWGNRTYWACSTFATGNPEAGDYNRTHIWGSVAITGVWADHGSGAYSTTVTGMGTSSDVWLWQRVSLHRDTILTRVLSTAACQSTNGSFYIGTNVVWVNPFDMGAGENANSYSWELPDHGIVVTAQLNYPTTITQVKHVTFWGIDFGFSHGNIFSRNYVGTNRLPDSLYVIHCKLRNVMGWAGVNPSGFAHGASEGTDAPMTGCKVTACSISVCEAYSSTATWAFGNNGTGVEAFDVRDFTVDSNVFIGRFSRAAFYFKCSRTIGPSYSNQITLAHNKFIRINESDAVQGFGYFDTVNIWGNLFYDVYGTGIKLFPSDTQNYPWDAYPDTAFGPVRILNNTFIECDQPISDGDYEQKAGSSFGYVWHHECEFKYNVLSSNTGWTIGVDNLTAPDGVSFNVIDSNLYVSGGTITYRQPTYHWNGSIYTGTARTQSYWQSTLGADVRSTIGTSAGLADTTFAGLDASRPAAFGEMNTTYGGREWTVYGAIQPTNELHITRITVDNTGGAGTITRFTVE